MFDDPSPTMAFDSALVPAQPRRAPVLIAAFRPACGPRSSLIGHVDATVPSDCVTIYGIAVHQQGSHAWITMPRDRPEARAMFFTCPPMYVDDIGAHRFGQWVIYELRRQHPEAFPSRKGGS